MWFELNWLLYWNWETLGDVILDMTKNMLKLWNDLGHAFKKKKTFIVFGNEQQVKVWCFVDPSIHCDPPPNADFAHNITRLSPLPPS